MTAAGPALAGFEVICVLKSTKREPIGDAWDVIPGAAKVASLRSIAVRGALA
jgi:hypothetical protein